MRTALARASSAGRLHLPVFALFAWIVIEDETRKLLGAPLAVYAVKDLLVLLAFTASVRGAPPGFLRGAMPPSLRPVLAWGLLLYVLGSFNPELSTFLIPVNGIHITFFAVPMVFAGYRLAGEPRRVEQLLWAMYGLAMAVAAVGLVQALLDPVFLNPQPDEMRSDWLVNIIRDQIPYVSGPFLSPGRYVAYLMNGGAASLSLYFLSARGDRRALALAGLVVLGGALVMSGARSGPVVLVLMAVVTVAISEARRRGHGLLGRDRQSRIAVLAAVGILVAGIALASSRQLATTLDFYWESLFAEGDNIRSRTEANFAFTRFDAATLLLGHGTGSASFGIQYVYPDFVPITEGGYSSIVWELGLLGLVFYVLLAFQITRVYLASPRGSPLREALLPGLGALAIVELWILNATGLVLQQYVVTIPLWFFIGTVWGLRRAEAGIGYGAAAVSSRTPASAATIAAP